jgi:YVTN family beta-propeller protein
MRTFDWKACRLRRALAWAYLIQAWLAVASAQTPVPALLVLEKGDNTLAVVDPAALKIVGRLPAGGDPHEIVVSPDGKLAYISNYGGLDSALNTITVVDLASQKPLAPISLGALRSPHGLDFAGGKLYFTVETNKAFGRYDPATRSVDWVLGTGQDRTHMIVVNEAEDRMVTSNVSSGSISIVEQVAAAPPSGAPAQGSPRKTWQITTVPSGRGSEGFDISPAGGEIWAANALDNTVTIIDARTKKPVSTFPVSVEHANRLKFTPDGKRVLISGLGAGANSGGANLAVLDAVTHKEIKKFDLGGGSAGILLAPDGRAYVAVSAKDKIVAIDLEKLEVVGQLATGKGPDGLAWAQSK